ncbi:uncharacterized protein MYCFIDRAFT_195178 [Pseudocercospora fijiensis CIRAD86]|nr:uncharacterized protein MYCFIDRAFT_195178 [Pseudocercospora fijiensis CIRAD86]EME83998.1 hypothetical protein MYCFIDRAFT_195178 [Pseudocercospora fijiensis CIRAD86]
MPPVLRHRDPATAGHLLTSYLENDYLLNPFINKNWLKNQLKGYFPSEGLLERSPENAIVCLAIALGAISIDVSDKGAVAKGYYDIAISIVGDQLDGDTRTHAQMFLLVALYHWRLAKPETAMSWIDKASRCILHLLRREHFREETQKPIITSPRQQEVVLAAWTAYLMWDSVAADLDLPTNTTLELLPRVPLPYDSNLWKDPDERYVQLHHISYIMLCDMLHRLCSELFPVSASDSFTDLIQRLQPYQESLNSWRRALDPSLRWDNDDSAPDDILSLRLRCEYWKACHLVRRPFLDHVLHNLDQAHCDLEGTVAFKLMVQDAVTACLWAGFQSIRYLNHAQRYKLPNAYSIVHA